MKGIEPTRPRKGRTGFEGLSSTYAIVMVRAMTAEEGVAVRDLGNLYWQLFLATILFAVHPALVTVVIVACGMVWYVTAAQWLHHDAPPLQKQLLMHLLLRRYAVAGRPA